MPDFTYYATFDESIMILNDLVQRCRIGIIPDEGTFRAPEAPSFESVTEEVVQHLRRRRVLFLTGAFTQHPAQLHKRDGGVAAGTYYISISEGGPLIHMTIATVNIVDGKSILVSGMVSHQKRYMSPLSGLSEPASIEIRQAYKGIVRTMKKRLVSHQLGLKTWIGPYALHQLEEGNVTIVDQGTVLGE